MARIPDGGDRAAEAGGFGRAARRGSWSRAAAPRRRPHRTLPLSRRPRALARRHAGKEPLALPRSVPSGRLADRLGDEGRRRSFRHAVEILRPSRSRSLRTPAPSVAEASTRRLPYTRRRRSRASAAGHRLLPRDPQAEPGGPRLPREARPRCRRDHRPVPARLLQPHPRLPPAGENRRLAQSSAAGFSQARGLLRPTGHELLRRLARRPGARRARRGPDVYGRKSATTSGMARPCHLYLPGPAAGVWNLAALAGSRTRSSSARRSSTP